jgi:hypothetical protein
MYRCWVSLTLNSALKRCEIHNFVYVLQEIRFVVQRNERSVGEAETCFLNVAWMWEAHREQCRVAAGPSWTADSMLPLIYSNNVTATVEAKLRLRIFLHRSIVVQGWGVHRLLVSCWRHRTSPNVCQPSVLCCTWDSEAVRVTVKRSGCLYQLNKVTAGPSGYAVWGVDLICWTLRPWVRISLKAWISVLVYSSSSLTFHTVIDDIYPSYWGSAVK